MEQRTHPVRTPDDDDPRAVPILLVSLALFLVVAILKPWAPPPFRGIDPPGAAVPTVRPQASMTPDPAVAEVRRVAAFCLEPNGWRVYADERWSDRDVRSWKTVQPIAVASGPTDRRIPVVGVSSRLVRAIGWCAPVAGTARPPSGSATRVFAVTSLPAGASAAQIVPPRLQPRDGPSSLGGVYGPPGGRPLSTAAGGWPDGVFVFRIAGGPDDAFVRWFAIQVENTRPLPSS
jgi:hypothetical protein